MHSLCVYLYTCIRVRIYLYICMCSSRISVTYTAKMSGIHFSLHIHMSGVNKTYETGSDL